MARGWISGAGGAVPLRRPTPELGAQFAYGGVAFEMLADFPVELADEHLLFARSMPRSAVAGEVRCAVTGDAAIDADGYGRDILWQWDGDRASIRTGRVRATLLRVSRGQYAATARVAPGRDGVSSLATALSGAIVNHAGGLVLHAAAIELDGRAVLFIGPSGAGKTTACNHALGARWLARDRVAIVPAPDGWSAWGMAGGDEVALPQSPRAALPLAAVLRVRRAADEGVRVRRMGPGEAVHVLRESVQSGGLSPEEEHRRLDSIGRLYDEVPVGVIETRLDHPITELLREWLGAEGV